MLQKSEQTKFNRSLAKFVRRFANETEATICYNSVGELRLRLAGSEELIEHGGMNFRNKNLTKLLASHKNLKQKLNANGRVIVPKQLRKELEVDSDCAHDLFSDIGFEMGVSQCLKTSVVTSRPIHVEILNGFFQNKEISRRNALIQRHLTCVVPFLDAVLPQELISLRQSESDSFIAFRHAFAKAVDEHLKSKTGQISDSAVSSRVTTTSKSLWHTA